MNNRFILIVMGIGLCLTAGLYPIYEARDTLGVIVNHIVYREKAAFMRFDRKAMEIMDRPDCFGQEMRYIYTSRFPGVYKASLRKDEHAEYTFNPLYMIAREDLNYCARFLKLLKKHTSLIICDKPFPEDLARKFFKKGCVQISVEHAEVEMADALLACCEEFLGEVDGFTIVVTSLRGIAPIIQYRLLQKRSKILLFDFDALWAILINPMQTLIDSSQLYRLTERNISCLCTGDLTEDDYQEHKERYIQRAQALHFFGYEPHIVETYSSPPTFLDANFNHVLYTHTHNAPLRDGESKETKAIRAFLEANEGELTEGDTLISFPEEYRLVDDRILRLVESGDCPEALAREGFRAIINQPCHVYQYMGPIDNHQ